MRIEKIFIKIKKIVKKVFLIEFFILLPSLEINPQANIIQSIDFDSQGRTIFAHTGFNDYSYAKRMNVGVFEQWNLTEMFNLPFYWISTSVDQQENIWAFLQNKLYKFNGLTWQTYDIPDAPTTYQKYSDLAIDDNYLWLSLWDAGVYSNKSLYRLRLQDSTWSIFNSTNSGFPEHPQSGIVFLKGDSTFVGTNKGLVLINNDSAKVILDTTNSNLATQAIYCFYIDSQGNRWLGTFNIGIVKWIDNSNFIIYNTDNSNLQSNFINAIQEDSQGRLWLATDNGFASFNGDSIASYNHLLDNISVATLAVDNNDKIWLGTAGTGALYVYDGNNLNLITDIAKEHSESISYELFQNYPNPFNPATIIKYSLPRLGNVQIRIYNILGTEIKMLLNEYKQAGTFQVEFNADDLPSGVYFYRITTENYSATKKMIVLR
jgi:ligand-binding sensor domain-containing protein